MPSSAVALGSALAQSSAWAISGWPCSTAMQSEVLPIEPSFVLCGARSTVAPASSSSCTACSSPCFAACQSGVTPLLLARSTAAPPASSTRIGSVNRFWAVMNSAVHPPFFCASTAAPPSSSARTASGWPSEAATISGVEPVLCGPGSGSALRSSSSRMMSPWSCMAAM